MKKKYVYDMGCVDFYKGMTVLSDYINLCSDNNYHPDLGYYGADQYMSHQELKKFLIDSFIEIKIHNTYWEGDIRPGEIAISAVPLPTGEEPEPFIVFKQDNNGHSFLVSDFLFVFREEHNITMIEETRDFNKADLLIWFDQSYVLTEKLFEYSAKENKLKPLKDVSLNDFDKI